IEYTDYSLRKFFKTVSTMPWYNNTLFVITADHTSSEIQFDETRTASGFYAVPVIYFKPDKSLSGRDSSITQQIDIMPSVLSYLKLDEPYIAYGRSVFNEATEPFAFNYKDNVYQLFSGDYLYQFDGKKGVGLYNFKTDKLLKINILKDEMEIGDRMEHKIQAIIQQYNNRMIEDRLT